MRIDISEFDMPFFVPLPSRAFSHPGGHLPASRILLDGPRKKLECARSLIYCSVVSLLLFSPSIDKPCFCNMSLAPPASISL